MRLDAYNKRQIEKYADEFFLRLQHTNPFPVSADPNLPENSDTIYKTYLSCMPRDIRGALLHLLSRDYAPLFKMNPSSSLLVPIPKDTSAQSAKIVRARILFHFEDYRPSATPHNGKTMFDPDHPMHDAVIQWIQKAERINHDYDRCRVFIHTIVDQANTAGQLRTMFPEYVRMLPEHQQQHISNMQKRSRLPKEADLEYLNATRSFVAEKLALCLLLPDTPVPIWVD